jgi:DNA-3-methyladenine glycosylase I
MSEEISLQSYCAFAVSEKAHPVHIAYHDNEYGFPLRDDNALFERLILEINQAGLSWETILKKQAGFRAAYDGFDIAKVAAYGEADTARLLSDPGIIRNRLKVNAAIENARTLLDIRDEYGSFAAWLDVHHPREKAEWVKLFKKTFRFTGGEIVGEFLMSTGYLPGAHDPNCAIYTKIQNLNPPWQQTAAPRTEDTKTL